MTVSFGTCVERWGMEQWPFCAAWVGVRVPLLPRAQAPTHLVIRKLCRVATHSGLRSRPPSRPCCFMGHYTLFPHMFGRLTCVDLSEGDHARLAQSHVDCSVGFGNFNLMPDLAQKWPPSELRTVVNQVASCALTYIFVTFSF